VLPELFGRIVMPQGQTDRKTMKSQQLRYAVAAYQQTDFRAEWTKGLSQVGLARQVMGDWAGSAVTTAITPMSKKAAVGKDEIVGQPVDQVREKAQEAQLTVKVEMYDPGQGIKNALRVTQAPLRVPAGSEITLYEQDGVVRYYALTEKPPESVAAITAELKTQKEALAGVETLKNNLSQMQQTLALKDQELVAVREQLRALEAKQARLEAAPELAKVGQMEAELKDLRTFRVEVEKFMKR
jgi:hypothetical protein